MSELARERDELLAELEAFDSDAPGAAARCAELAERVADLDERVTVERSHELIRRYQSGELRSEGGSVGGGRIGDGRGHLSPLFPSASNLALLEQARRNMSSMSVIEERSALATTDFGSRREYGPGNLLAPRTLWRASNIPTSPLAGYDAVVPQITLPAGAALVAEGQAHAEFDSAAPDTVTIARTGAWSDLTSEAMLSTALGEIVSAHARILARDLDKAAVAKIEQSPGALDLDEALVSVAAECAVDVTALWIVGDPLAVAALVGIATAMTPTNATDLASWATRYGGATIYPTPAATARQLTVFDPNSFRAFASPLGSAVVVDPKSGKQTFGQWQFFGLGQTLVGSAVTVDVGGS